MAHPWRLLAGVALCLSVGLPAAAQLQPLNDNARRNAYVVYNIPDSAVRAVMAPDVTGEHFACKLWLNDGKQAIVVDGVQQESYTEVTMPFVGDYGARIAYIADKTKLIVDGKLAAEHKEFALDSPEAVVFSQDGKHMAYCASDGDGWFVSKDGDRSDLYARVWSPAMPSDGSRLAFCAEDGSGKRFVVLDGKPQESYDDVSDPTFSSDGKRFAFAGKKGDSWSVVLDGAKGSEPYAGVKELTFSDDGKRFAYAAKVGDSEFVVLDGQRQQGYEAVDDLVFSPKGARFGHAARARLRWHVVVDGEAGDPYDSVRGLVFLADSREYLYTCQDRRRARIVVGKLPQMGFEWNSNPVATTSGNTAFYIMVTGQWFDRTDRAKGLKPGAHVYQAAMGIASS
jgi:WD40 repeat protein